MMEGLEKKWNSYRWLRPAVVWTTLVLCTVIILTLCMNEAVDYDEAYAYTTVRGNSIAGIWNKILSEYSTDVPVWYSALRIWTYLFGESIFACKMFSLAGTISTMILGATVILRKWGTRSAMMFIVSVSLTPQFLHYSINIRMYSWMLFCAVVCMLLAYELVSHPEKRGCWLLLFFLTVVSLMSHLMTAFFFIFVYGYLLLEMVIHNRKQSWKVFACGVTSLIPFGCWVVASGFLHYADTSGEEHPFGFYKIDWRDAVDFVFHTELYRAETYVYGFALLALTVTGLLLFRKKFRGKGEVGFLWFSLISYFGSYFLAATISSVSTHFFTPRHVMMGVVLMWLTIAIVLPRWNVGAWLAGMAVLAAMCVSSYQIEYRWEYMTAPYMEETKEMIATEMEAGDIVLYNTDDRFAKIYSCYMPEQSFVNVGEIDGAWLQEHKEDRVWYFWSEGIEFPAEYIETYGIEMENIGHYGFQIIYGYTDFDAMRLTIRGAVQ